MYEKMTEKTKIENTYAEALTGLYCRVKVTADDEETLKKAAYGATALPSEAIGRLEGGIEKWLPENETPDSRRGAILQFWKGLDRTKPLEESIKRFEKELSYRIRQGILVRPFTAVFDALSVKAEGKIDMMEIVGHCGDGDEWEEQRYGRNMIIVPIMVPDFPIERHISYAKGVSGGNFWYMCSTKKAVIEAGNKALEVINQVDGVVTPFGICSAGSKTETHFPLIGPTTNNPYCPSLKQKLGKESSVPEGVNYIPEIVINGISIQAVKKAMKVGIEAALAVDDVLKISAGNYDGKLGDHKIYLHELFL
jgi:formylmethanofuran--tetrahydromethanopterin N-formyltransferase